MARNLVTHKDGGNSFYDIIDNPFDNQTRLATSGVSTVVVFEKTGRPKWADWRYPIKKERVFYNTTIISKDT